MSGRGPLPKAELERAVSGLKPFQKRTVETVVEAMFERGQRRFLVADEVGLGKTKIARSLVAETITRLWDKPDVDRIDVVYICSNQQIARQNVEDLMVLPGSARNLVDRITMLPAALNNLGAVNVVAFTPSTSLSFGHAGGKAGERAMLYRILSDRAGMPWIKKRARAWDLFSLGTKNFVGWESYLRTKPIPEGLIRAFVSQLQDSGILDRLDHATDGRRSHDPSTYRPLVSAMRRALAKCCIGFLTPDLIILDEFQQFTDVLDAKGEDGELANMLLQDSDARVLLLSATPYKMLTNAADDESHFEGFERTVRFLLGPGRESELTTLRRGLEDIRTGLLGTATRRRAGRGLPPGRVGAAQRDGAHRATRRDTGPRGHVGHRVGACAVRGDEGRRRGVHRRRRCREYLRGVPSMVEYWKSAPYLFNFMDDYKVKSVIRQRLREGDRTLAKALRGRQPLTLAALDGYKKIDPLNGRLRWLVDDLAKDNAFDLLWIPPAMPQTTLSANFDQARSSGMTKRLLFSGWTVVPKAVAAMTSFEFERRHHRPDVKYREATKKFSGRLVADRSTTLAVHLPCRFLAQVGDPVAIASDLGVSLPVDREDAERHARAKIADALDPLIDSADHSGPERPIWYAAAMIHLDRSLADLTSADFNLGARVDSKELARLLAELRQGVNDTSSWGRPPDDLVDVLTSLALAGPGVSVVRGLGRLVARHGWDVEDVGLLRQAAGVAWSFRTLFNSPEADALVSQGGTSTQDYWRDVVDHCLDGGLNAVVDEWFDLLPDQERISRTSSDVGSDSLRSVAGHASRVLRLSDGLAYVDRFSGQPVDKLPRDAMRTHFAMRYGQARGDTADGENPTDVRNAFNSPFRPFVLVSTSVGQEGLDFHYYAHAIVHWNLPGNPVDLEQREGRVHRYKNHAVRKNVADCVSDDPSFDPGDDPWRTAFKHVGESYGGLSPWWIFPGKAAIQRLVPMLPLSREHGQLDRLVEATSLYRMTMGQPRQSELLEVLGQMDESEQKRMREAIAVNLSP